MGRARRRGGGPGELLRRSLGVPVLAPTLRTELDLSVSEVGIVLGSIWIGPVLTLLPWGLAADRSDPTSGASPLASGSPRFRSEALCPPSRSLRSPSWGLEASFLFLRSLCLLASATGALLLRDAPGNGAPLAVQALAILRGRQLWILRAVSSTSPRRSRSPASSCSSCTTSAASLPARRQPCLPLRLRR